MPFFVDLKNLMIDERRVQMVTRCWEVGSTDNSKSMKALEERRKIQRDLELDKRRGLEERQEDKKALSGHSRHRPTQADCTASSSSLRLGRAQRAVNKSWQELCVLHQRVAVVRTSLLLQHLEVQNMAKEISEIRWENAQCHEDVLIYTPIILFLLAIAVIVTIRAFVTKL